MIGIIGKKIGMSQFLMEDGTHVPVTFVSVEPNEIMQIKTVDKDGYAAVILGADPYKNPSKNKKFKKVKEFRIAADAEYKKGDQLAVDVLTEVEAVTITAVSKGKGFQGPVKRHNFSIIRETHGTKYARHGSTGACAMPGRTKPGQKMAGHMGLEQVTLKKRKLHLVDKENNVIAIKGAVPGARNTYVFIKTY